MSNRRISKTITESKPKGANNIFTKSVIRNIDVPIKSAVDRYCVKKHFTTEEGNIRKPELPKADSAYFIPVSGCSTSRYNTPECNTVLNLAKELEKSHIHKPIKIKSTGDLTPRSRAVVLPKINKKLNFPADKVLYKNLIPINVNNSLLLPKERVKVRKKYKSSGSSDPIPDLADFLDPVKRLEHVIPQPELRFETSHLEINAFERFFNTYLDIYPHVMNVSSQFVD